MISSKVPKYFNFQSFSTFFFRDVAKKDTIFMSSCHFLFLKGVNRKNNIGDFIIIKFEMGCWPRRSEQEHFPSHLVTFFQPSGLFFYLFFYTPDYESNWSVWNVHDILCHYLKGFITYGEQNQVGSLLDKQYSCMEIAGTWRWN